MKIKKKNLFIDLILIIITGGIWNIWMQYRQIRDFNSVSNSNQYSFLKWLFFSLITFGIYHIYHEYKLTRDFCLLNEVNDAELIGIFSGIVSATGFWFIIDLYQQSLLNEKV